MNAANTTRRPGSRHRRLARALNHLSGLPKATRQIVAQTRQRVAAVTSDGASRSPIAA
ncbi:hypothetical protein MSM1_07850 [Mycobacterium sp. SM1]|nr:hypothetical protein [Mycobacterium sp. SM1]